MPASVKSARSSRSTRSSASRRRKRRSIAFETASVESGDLSGFHLPEPAPTVQEKPKPQIAFSNWRALPDGKYNFLDGKWVPAPTPRNIFSIGSKYEICEGRLYQWY